MLNIEKKRVIIGEVAFSAFQNIGKAVVFENNWGQVSIEDKKEELLLEVYKVKSVQHVKNK